MNANVGNDNNGNEFVMGKGAMVKRNNNGRIPYECTIGGSIFKHKIIHKETWISPGGKSRNQID